MGAWGIEALERDEGLDATAPSSKMEMYRRIR